MLCKTVLFIIFKEEKKKEEEDAFIQLLPQLSSCASALSGINSSPRMNILSRVALYRSCCYCHIVENLRNTTYVHVLLLFRPSQSSLYLRGASSGLDCGDYETYLQSSKEFL